METASSWFDAFIKHGSIVSCLLSLLFGWGVSILARFPIHRLIRDDGIATYLCYCACVLGSCLVTAGSWPNDFRWAWAGTMGVVSPLLGFVALWQVGKRWPDLHAMLAMRKITPPELPDTGDDSRAPATESSTTEKDNGP